MVGLLEDVRLTVPTGFTPGQAIVILGDPPQRLGSSEYQPDNPDFPRFDLESERRLTALLRELAARRLLRSAQDVANGGLAMALAECALLGDCGCTVRLEHQILEVALFSEDQGRAVVSCSPSVVDDVLRHASAHCVAASVVGGTRGDRFIVEGAIDLGLTQVRRAWEPEP